MDINQTILLWNQAGILKIMVEFLPSLRRITILLGALNRTNMKTLYRLILFFITLACAGKAQAQSLTPSVLASGGRFATGGGYSLSETVGEMTMVQTFTAGSSILTQGFQQPADANVGLPVVQLAGYGAEIFPNPAVGLLNFDFVAADQVDATINMLDVLGQVLTTEQAYIGAGKHRVQLDLSNHPQGIYFAEVTMRKRNGELAYRSAHRLRILH